MHSIFIEDKVYIIEFKVDSKAAIDQLRAKRYQQKYLKPNRDIYLIGIEFNSKTKSVEEVLWEKVE